MGIIITKELIGLAIAFVVTIITVLIIDYRRKKSLREYLERKKDGERYNNSGYSLQNKLDDNISRLRSRSRITRINRAN